MGLIALYTGLLLWRLFIRLDSLRYPILSYADIVERIFGTRARRVSTILQSVQLVVFVRYIPLIFLDVVIDPRFGPTVGWDHLFGQRPSPRSDSKESRRSRAYLFEVNIEDHDRFVSRSVS